jgi:hypothetical protein
MSSAAAGAALLLLVALGCKRPEAQTGPATAERSPPTPLRRSIHIGADRVVLEGRWQPLDVAGGPAGVPSAVRVVCERQRASCLEERTAPGALGAPPSGERAEYGVTKWTSWTLAATRRTATGDEVELSVALKGGAATKSLTRRGAGDPLARWRLE